MTNQPPIVRYRQTLGLATALMIALSWPLWTGTASFPQVPFVAGLSATDRRVASTLATALLIATVLGSFGRTVGVLSRLASVLLLGLLVLGDQQRFQPWVYLYLISTTLDLLLRPDDFLKAGRLWYVGIYVHSGLSKLDASFRDEFGRLLLDTGLGFFGLDSEGWSDSTRNRVVLALPTLEILMAAMLLLPTTRRFGCLAARSFHLGMLLLLGPLGLDHSLILWVWNLAMFFQVGSLFGPDRADSVETQPVGPFNQGVRTVVFGGLTIGLLLPFTERSGWLDPWPAHALYAGHVERLTIYLHEGDLADYPEALRRHLEPDGRQDGPWRRLDLTGWSRAVRGTPIYPRNRAGLGIGEALATWRGKNHLVKIVEWSTADRWTKDRERREYVGVEMIRLRRRRFFLNAAPFVLQDSS